MLTNRTLFYIAQQLVAKEFYDKKDKAGVPYEYHLYSVAEIAYKLVTEREAELVSYYGDVDLEKLVVVALLHDLFEDTDWTRERLEKTYGFPEELIDSIESVTRAEGESYMDFIERASEDRYGIIVKFADLTNNLDVTRLKKLDVKEDVDRINKYLKAYNRLKSKLFLFNGRDDIGLTILKERVKKFVK